LCAGAGIFLFAFRKAKIPSRGSRKISVREFICVRTEKALCVPEPCRFATSEAGSSALSIFQVSEEKYLVTGDHTTKNSTQALFFCATEHAKICILAPAC